MAIAFVDKATAAANNPLSGNFPLPATWAAGNLAIFWWYGRTLSKTFADNSGGKYTILWNSSTSQGTLVIAWRILQSGDVATDFAWTSPSINAADVCYGTSVFSGADGTTPIEADSGTPTIFNNTQSPDPPLVAVATTNACVITVFGKNNDAAASVTQPTNYSDGGWIESIAGSDASAGLAYRLALAIGNEDPGAWTLGGAATDDGLTYTASIKPAAAGATRALFRQHPYAMGVGGSFFADPMSFSRPCEVPA